MSTEVLAQALTASVQATFGQGSIWYLKTASAPLTITAESAGSGAANRVFTNISAGFKFIAKAGESWTYLRVLSQVSQNIEIIVGNDDVTVAGAVTILGGNIIASGSVSLIGTSSTAEAPAVTMSDIAPVLTVTGQAALIPNNAGRRRVTLSGDPFNSASVYIRKAGGANDLMLITAGGSVECKGTYALDYRDASAGGQIIYVAEES